MRRRKLKRTTKQYIIVAFICIIVIGSAALLTSIITIGQIREEYEHILKEAKKEIEENRKKVYVALSNIRTGDIITSDNVEEQIVYSSQSTESYITESEIGKAAIIDIPKGSHLVKSMVAAKKVSSKLREVEYDMINISSNIASNDYVDVRIFYPNGENYIVMSKKSIKGLQPGSPTCYMWVDEEELLRMSAAIVDAALYKGTSLFMTKYIESNIQEASIITYIPNLPVLSLLEHNPNIMESCSQLLNMRIRMALENQLAEGMGIDVYNTRWEINNPDIPLGYRGYEQLDKGEEKTEEIFEEKVGDNNIDKTDMDIKERVNEDEEYKYSPELGTRNRYDYEDYHFASEG